MPPAAPEILRRPLAESAARHRAGTQELPTPSASRICLLDSGGWLVIRGGGELGNAEYTKDTLSMNSGMG